MSFFNRVIWSEGLFLRPQHLQQQDRAIERYVELRIAGALPHAWGFTELEIDPDLRAMGKLALRRARGIFPDGTAFAMPEDDDLPPAIDIGRDVRNALVQLAIPLRRPGASEVTRKPGNPAPTRYAVREYEVRDVTKESSDAVPIEVGSIQGRLSIAGARSDDLASLTVGRILETRGDGTLLLDDGYMPPVLSIRAAAALGRFAAELLGMMRQRGESLALGAVSTTRGQAADIQDFLFLQALNRYEPLVAHAVAEASFHPEQFYQLCLQLAGDLSTLFSDTKRVSPYLAYQHHDLESCFRPVMVELRQLMGSAPVQRTMPIPLKYVEHGVYSGVINDKSLFDVGEFYLAVNAELPADEIGRLVPRVVTVCGVEAFRDLYARGVGGVTLALVPAPREIPVHRGFTYFKIDERNPLYKDMKNSAAVVIHMPPDNLPNAKIEFWVVRR